MPYRKFERKALSDAVEISIAEYGGIEMTRRMVLIYTYAVLATIAAAVVVGWVVHHWRHRAMAIQGAVIRKDADARRQLPIADVVVTASDGAMTANTQSDASGYFKLIFPESVWKSQVVVLSFRHPDYEPLDLNIRTDLRTNIESRLRSTATMLQVAAMEGKPTAETELDQPSGAAKNIAVSNIRIRYTENSGTEQNIGSAVKTFQVVNQGNQPCKKQLPCSPDGHWKASSGSITLDAGTGNEFRNVRASCIAGPCPFTRIDASGFAHGGRNIKASALSWSDTATFLLEAEVFHLAISSNVRESYPVIFGRSLNFTLPPTQEGVSLEAEIDGTPMVFPLGPALYLSWANCTGRSNGDELNTTVYRCELKTGYHF